MLVVLTRTFPTQPSRNRRMAASALLASKKMRSAISRRARPGTVGMGLPAQAFDQGHAKPPLEFADLQAHRRLRQVEVARGSGKPPCSMTLAPRTWTKRKRV